MISVRREYEKQIHVIVASSQKRAEEYIQLQGIPPEQAVYLSSVDIFPMLNVASVRIHPLYQWFNRPDHREIRELMAEFTHFNSTVNDFNFDCIYRP
jgi:hypothetical protein